MKYEVINELDNFSYHDAEVDTIEFVSGSMIWKTDGINATKSNSQNTYPKDMCIDEAIIILDSVLISKIVILGYKRYQNKKLIYERPEVEAEESEYEDIFKEICENRSYIYGMYDYVEVNDRFEARFEVDSWIETYQISVSFEQSTVKWNKFYGEVWYEDPKWKK